MAILDPYTSMAYGTMGNGTMGNGTTGNGTMGNGTRGNRNLHVDFRDQLNQPIHAE